MRRLLLLSAAILTGSSARADEKYVTIKGQVKWNGAKAPAVELVVFNNHPDTAACCKAGPLAATKYEVDSKSLGLKNVTVWLRVDSTKLDDPFPVEKIHADLAKPKSKEHVIDQPMCQFVPRVTAARAGDTLVVKNSAPIGHNVKYSSEIEEFNINCPAGASVKPKKSLEAQRRPATVACSIHGWMEARVYVFDHPYFAVTDKDGKFEIKDAPVGKWRVVYQHEGGYHKGKEGAYGFPLELKGDKKTLEMGAVKYEWPPTPSK